MVEIGPISSISAKTYYFFKNAAPFNNVQVSFCVWLSANKSESKQILANLKFWIKGLGLDQEVYLLDFDQPDFIRVLCELDKQNGVFIMPFFYLAQVKIFLTAFREQLIELRAGQVLSPRELKEKLIDRGYESSREELPGTFKHRGSLLTIYSPNYDRPVKVEFDEEKIIRINKEIIEIFPVDLDLNKIARMAKEPIKSNLLKNARFIYADPSLLKREEGWPAVNDQIKDNHQIIFQTLKSKNVLQINFKKPKFYNKNLKKFVVDLKSYLDNNWQVGIAVLEAEVIKNILKSNNLVSDNIKFFDYSVDLEGFEDLDSQYLFLTHQDIFGRIDLKKKIKSGRGARLRMNPETGVWVADLKPGDYIVHQDHGIGLYQGLVKTEIDGFQRENLLLEYAQGDKLYTPIDLAYKVDKYIGQAKPTIYRLSGTSWQQLTQKIKADAEKLAKELLNLYAQREVIKISPWQKIQPEERDLAQAFAYQETTDQQTAIKQIFSDLERDKPMDRLIVGDVGFGKTEVAIRAAFKAVMNNQQVAVLCPTTILAQQHYDTFKDRLKKFPVEIEALSRFTKRLSGIFHEKKVLAGLEKGIVDVVIGTHRLLS
ncbi:MAG TPA: CarD family transcriptional regulator, partial [Patescibacteria group bacterium]